MTYNGPRLKLKDLKKKLDLEKELRNNAAVIVKYLYTVDGDTICVSINGIRIRIRLLVVDCKELSDKEGEDARNFTKRIMDASSEVIIQIDNISKLYDKYDRLLMWVWVKIKEEYQLLQYLLVKNHMAVVKYIDSEKSLYVKELLKIE